MSKRELSHNEEEKIPGSNPTKKVKGSQNQELISNGNLSPPKNRQNQSSNIFRINSVATKPSQEVEDDLETLIDREKQARITEIVLDSDSDASYYSQDEETEVSNTSNQKINLKKMPNVLFYLNMVSSQPQGDFIDNIHAYWKSDYKKLEIHHGYIQWLFPNFGTSGFNKDSFKLLKEEAKIFRENKEISERIIKSYELILEFFGIKLADKKTGRLARTPNFEKRYRATFITSTNNHVRIKRILAHLNVVGFRQYAIQLVNFLEEEIYGEKGGYNKYLEQSKPLKPEYLLSVRGAPLFHLIKYDIFKDWKVYGNVSTSEEEELLFKSCFTNDESDYEPSILLKY